MVLIIAFCHGLELFFKYCLLQFVVLDSDDDKREEGVMSSSRIPSSSFLAIMEESIRTFMDFMKQDKKSHYQILADLFRKNKRGSADATLLVLLKKVNKKVKPCKKKSPYMLIRIAKKVSVFFSLLKIFL